MRRRRAAVDTGVMKIGEARAAARELCEVARREESEGRPAAAADAYRAAIDRLVPAVGPDDGEVQAAKRSCVALLVELGRDAEAATLSSS